MKPARFCLLCLLATAGIASAQWPHLNRKLENKAVVVRSALIMPAEVEFDKVSVKGSEGGIAQAEQISDSFYKAFASELALRGVTVLRNPADWTTDDRGRFAISDLQSKYANIAVQLRRKPGRVEKGAYTLGDRVGSFEPARGADVLIFLRGAGVQLTRARNAIGVATLGATQVGPRFTAEVCFVDARSGEVLVYFRFSRRRDMTMNGEDSFSRYFRYWLAAVPLPGPVPKK